MRLRIKMAWHVLLGRPLMYRMGTIKLADTLYLPERAMVVGNHFYPTGPSALTAVRAASPKC